MKKIMCLLLVAFALMSSCAKKKESVILVGTEPTFPPFEFVNEDDGEIVGFDIDLIKAIAEDQGLTIEIKNLGFDGLIPAVLSGNIKIVAAGMTITSERQESVNFSKPYIAAGLALAVAFDDNTIKSLADLKSKTVGVQIGTTGAIKAKELKKEGLLKSIKVFNTIDMVMLDLLNGGVDAVINDLPVTNVYIDKQKNKIKLVGEPLSSESYGFAIAKSDEDLLKKINAGLDNVIKSGKYQEILSKYF